MSDETAKRGRPTQYTAELAKDICEKLAEGMSLREVCRNEDYPAESTVRLWALENRDGFSAHYTRARELGYQAMADELLEIADDARNDWTTRRQGEDEIEVADHDHISRSRLRVDTRKWLLSKALPKIYGDKLVTEHTGPNGGPIQTATIDAKKLSKKQLEALATIHLPANRS